MQTFEKMSAGPRSGEDKVKGPDEEREEEFASGPLSLLMQVSARRWFVVSVLNYLPLLFLVLGGCSFG